MNRIHLRAYELAALWAIAIGALILGGYMVYLGRAGEAFGSLLGIIPLCINRIGNAGQAQAMQSMVDHLARSTPSDPVKPEGTD